MKRIKRMLALFFALALCAGLFGTPGFSQAAPSDAGLEAALPTELWRPDDLAVMPKSGESLPGPHYSEDRVLVKLAAGNGPRLQAAEPSPRGLGIEFSEMRLLNPAKEGATIQSVNDTQNNVFSLTLTDTGPGAVERALEILNANPLVEIAEPNYLYKPCAAPNDPMVGTQWALDRIDAEQAWDITKGSKSVVVGIIDTGIDGTHPDLKDNLWVNPNPDPNMNDVHGYNFEDRIGGTPTDPNGHGTHVAGIVGAKGNNGMGVCGINWDVSLAWMGAPLGGIYISTDACIAALNYANNHDIPITNNSYGGGEYSAIFEEAVQNYKGLFVAAAGNEKNNNDLHPSYPANFDSPNIITVAAADWQEPLSDFSNYGKNTVHIAAPGSDIMSTWPDGGYNSISGTSMASPYVAGVAALVLAKNPGFTTAQVKAAVLNGAVSLPQYANRIQSGRSLDAYYALYPTRVPVQSVSVIPESLTLNIGDTGRLTAEVFPTNAHGRVLWESSDPGTAMVFQDGSVTGLQAGTATITARSYIDPGRSASATVTVTGVHSGAIIFRDINFKQGVIDALKDLDYAAYGSHTTFSSIFPSDAQKLLYLQLDGKRITDMEGIQHFTELEWFWCSRNRLTSLNVTQCPKLFELRCFHNQLSNLNASGCSALSILYCSFNLLTSLDVSGCPQLRDVLCQKNQLTSLDVSQCPELADLWCGYNPLTSLDVTKCQKLSELECTESQLTGLDVSRCPELKTLYCSINKMTSLQLSGCTKLEILWCFENQLTRLDVSQCSTLIELQCCENQLTNLDISRLPNLKYLWCRFNQLTGLDVSRCPELVYLTCYDNRLTSLDIGRNTKLEGLQCDYNQLTRLDVSQCPELQCFLCSHNQLASLDASQCPKLNDIDFTNNPLKSIAANICGGNIRLTAEGPGYVELYKWDYSTNFYAQAIPVYPANVVRWTESGAATAYWPRIDLAHGRNYNLTAHFEQTAEPPYEPPYEPPTPNTIFSTRYPATILNWILFFLCFGWIWMWF